ncbi:MAG: neutral zinc metallopeptidase [Candidatus Cryptobacteroides sp.]|nr:neutral zinc metallopeptidase [Candidatus Cryptobacteroides sp.]
MKLDGRRESTNVDDRRGLSGGTKAGLGLGGVLIVGLLTLLMGGDLGDIFQAVQQNGGLSAGGQQTEQVAFSQEEQELATFAKRILASTEDVWTAQFAQYGLEYQAPTMVLYTNATTSGCGSANASVGPFYCSADQKLYIDLSFFKQMESQLGARGEFARAYVIAHEVGHHVEYLLGSLGKAHAQMQQSSKAKANQISVRLELLADYYAGVWAHNEGEAYSSISNEDIRSAINCAQKIGDDILTKGQVSPESFTHGTAEQRMRWLKRGMQTGDMNTTTFNVDYNSL